MEKDTRTKHLSYLVSELTTSGKDTLEEGKMKQLKKICKHSEFYVILLWGHLQKQMKKQHAEIRLSAFQICDEIFHRSHCFRELLLKDFTDFAALTIGFDPENPLPKPVPVAKKMQQKAIEAVQRWYDKFKDGYHTLRLGYKYLKEVKNVDFEELTARTEEERQRVQESERKAEETKKKKIAKVKEEMEESCDDIKECLTQFHNSFRLLIPDVHDFYIPFDDEGPGEGESSKQSSDTSTKYVKEDGEMEEYGSSYMQEHGLTKGTSVKIDADEVRKIQETSDNDIIIASIREQSDLLISKYFPQVKRWEQIMMQYSAGNAELIKRIIDEKNRIERAVKMYSSLNIVKKKAVWKDKDDSDSDDDFIDVPEKTEAPIPESVLLGIESNCTRNVKAVYGTTSKSFKTSALHGDDPMNQPSTSGLQNVSNKASLKSSNKKGKMTQKKCPDSFLEEEWVPPAKLQSNMVGLSQVWVANEDLHEEVEGKSAGILGIDTRIVDYQLEFEPVKWECRAPLPSGRLCPRMDRKRCPLHGLIVPRDLIGQVVRPEDVKKEKEEKERQERENPAWQDPELLAAIRAETGVDLDMKKAKLKKRKHSNLTNLKELGNTPRKRLADKVLSKKALRRVNVALAKTYSATSRGHFNFG